MRISSSYQQKIKSWIGNRFGLEEKKQLLLMKIDLLRFDSKQQNSVK